MDKKRLKELAGIPLTEMMEEDDLQGLVLSVFNMANEDVWQIASESGRAINHDEIHARAMEILQALGKGVEQKIADDFGGKQ